MILETILTLALHAAPEPDAPTTTTAHSREWAVNRPTRGTHARVVARASTVPPRWRPFAACVLHRESGGTLDRPQSGVGALNGDGSGAAGRWQFLGWEHGGPYQVKDRLERFGMSHKEARRIRVWLSAHPIPKWHGLYQDVLFLEAVERGGALRHWGNGDRCDGLVAR